MAVTSSPRLGLTRWSAGTDPQSRAQFDADHGKLDQLAAIYGQGLFNARPAAGVAGRYYYATDTARHYYDTGTAWVNVTAFASAGTPAALGTAARGTSDDAARHDHVHPMPTAADVGAPPTTRAVTAGTGLTGGGDLSANRSLAVDFPAAGAPAAPGDADHGTAATPARSDHVHPEGTTGDVLAHWVSTGAATATSTTPVAVPGINGQTFTLPTARKVRIDVHAQTCTGATGGELGRLTLGGAVSRRSQFQINGAGGAGEISTGLYAIVDLAAGTHTITLDVLRVITGTSVTVQTVTVTVTDAGPTG